MIETVAAAIVLGSMGWLLMMYLVGSAVGNRSRTVYMQPEVYTRPEVSKIKMEPSPDWPGLVQSGELNTGIEKKPLYHATIDAAQFVVETNELPAD